MASFTIIDPVTGIGAKVAADGTLQTTSGGGGGSTVSILGFSTITPGYPTEVMVGTNSTLLLSANANRAYAHFVNNSSQGIFIQYQETAALNQGVYLSPKSIFTIDQTNLWLGIVNGIGVIDNQPISVLEGE